MVARQVVGIELAAAVHAQVLIATKQVAVDQRRYEIAQFDAAVASENTG
jgi:hypothetical protein